MSKRKQSNKSVEVIDIRKKTIRKIKFTEEHNGNGLRILPLKNNKSKRTNVQRQVEHGH